MKMNKEQLLNDLTALTKDHIQYVKTLKTLPKETLQLRKSDDSWNTLECLEHLNYYGNFYLPEITMRLAKADTVNNEQTFKSGILGNYFAKSMWPEDKLNTMNTFKSMNPIGTALTNATLDETIQQLMRILEILEEANQYSLTKTKTSITISKWITLRLGDTLRVIIYHNERHMRQIKRILK